MALQIFTVLRYANRDYIWCKVSGVSLQAKANVCGSIGSNGVLLYVRIRREHLDIVSWPTE